MKIDTLYGAWQILEEPQNRKAKCICTKCMKTIKDVDVSSLKRGLSKSCGCKTPIKIGEIYNHLEVSHKGQSRGSWYCKCHACNSSIFKEIRGTDLRRGSVKSCGCKQYSSDKKDQIKIGDQFGDWEVISSPIQGSDVVLCKSSRGTEKKIDIYHLLNGKTKSDGLLRHVHMKETCLKKYGVDNPFKALQVQDRRSETLQEKYGVDHPSQRVSNRNKLKEWCEDNSEKLFTSKAEQEILDWIKTFYQSTKKYKVEGNELDIYIPEIKLGIEYNGLYWHSTSRDRITIGYHLNKTKFFKEKGIRVIHIFEHEWLNNKDQVKSFIQSAIGKNSNKVGARKCEFVWSDKTKDKKEVRKFLNKYHIQGQVGCRYVLKAMYNGELIGCATFGKHHRNSTDWVLSRFCTKTNYTIQGSLAKMSKMASKKLDADIISWAHYRISDGNGYLKAGWIYEELSRPDYFYYKGRKIISKQSRQKSVVGTPDDMTESEHAKLDGLEKVYDCGKIRFKYIGVSQCQD